MNTEVVDTFHVTELFLLSAAFHAHGLFGLPDKKTYQFQGEEVFAASNKALINKGILSDNGEITRAGAFVIKSLEYYYNSDKYVRINNLMLAFREENNEEIIVLIEVKFEQFRLVIMPKADVFKLLVERFPFMLREPNEDEKKFLTKRLANSEKHVIEKEELEDTSMNIETFYLDAKQVKNYKQWIVFERNNKLIIIDVTTKEYLHASQHWFLKIIFDALDFPYNKDNEIYA